MGDSGLHSQEPSAILSSCPWQDMSLEEPCRQLVPNRGNVPEKDRGQGSSSQHLMQIQTSSRLMQLPVLRAQPQLSPLPPQAVGCLNWQRKITLNLSFLLLPSLSLHHGLAAPTSEQAQNFPCKEEQTGKHPRHMKRCRGSKQRFALRNEKKCLPMNSSPCQEKEHVLQQKQRQKNVRFNN